jgi:hypothetical protein
MSVTFIELGVLFTVSYWATRSVVVFFALAVLWKMPLDRVSDKTKSYMEIVRWIFLPISGLANFFVGLSKTVIVGIILIKVIPAAVFLYMVYAK